MVAVIGIDRYVSWSPLSNAVSDAAGARALFQRLGFQEVVAPLFDEHATRDAIEALVVDELMVLDRNDNLVLFYAGHGGTRLQQVGESEVETGYLIPVDGANASGRVASWIELDPWLRRVSKLPPRHILVILDACHSGIALSSLIKWRGEATLQNASYAALQARPSRLIITSARGDELAMDNGPVHGHSLFTGCLIEGLTGGLPRDVLWNGRSVTTGVDIGQYVRRRVQSFPGPPGWRQTPDFGRFDFDARGEMLIPLLVEETTEPSPPAPDLAHSQTRASSPELVGPIAAPPAGLVVGSEQAPGGADVGAAADGDGKDSEEDAAIGIAVAGPEYPAPAEPLWVENDTERSPAQPDSAHSSMHASQSSEIAGLITAPLSGRLVESEQAPGGADVGAAADGDGKDSEEDAAIGIAVAGPEYPAPAEPPLNPALSDGFSSIPVQDSRHSDMALGPQLHGTAATLPTTVATAAGSADDLAAKGVDGAVATGAVVTSEARAAPTRRQGRQRLWRFAPVVALGILISLRCIVAQDAQVTVVAHTWRRTVAIEEFNERAEEAWRNEVPVESDFPVCHERQRSTRQVEDGEDCRLAPRDSGDGTSAQVKKCTPKYRTEPVMDSWCRFTARRWKQVDEVKAVGTGMNPGPWPTNVPAGDTPAQLGARRQGRRTETLSLDFRDHGSCDVPDPVWRKYTDGQKLQVEFQSSSGDVVCSSL